MPHIKTEGVNTNENILVCNTSNNKSESKSHDVKSQLALSGNNNNNNSINNSDKKKSIQNVLDSVSNKKMNFSDFILSPTTLFNTDKAERRGNSNSPSQTQPFIKSEPLDTQSTFTTNENGGIRDNSHISNNKRIYNSSLSCTKDHKRKKNKTINCNTNNNSSLSKAQNCNAIKKVINNKNGNVCTDETKQLDLKYNQFDIPRDPTPFNQINDLLFDRDDNNKIIIDEVFQDIEKIDERESCKEIALFSLDEWIDYGETLLQENNNLVHDLIKTRIELSYKFEIISNVLNQRVEALNLQGNNIDDKLKQVKDIANNILNVL